MRLVLLLSFGVVVNGQQQCANTACITTAACGVPDNSSSWHVVNQTIDNRTASNLKLFHLSALNIVNCPGEGKACHIWGPGFGDRNGVQLLNGALIP